MLCNLKNAAKTLNQKDDVREKINNAFCENGLENLQYKKIQSIQQMT